MRFAVETPSLTDAKAIVKAGWWWRLLRAALRPPGRDLEVASLFSRPLALLPSRAFAGTTRLEDADTLRPRPLKQPRLRAGRGGIPDDFGLCTWGGSPYTLGLVANEMFTKLKRFRAWVHDFLTERNIGHEDDARRSLVHRVAHFW